MTSIIFFIIYLYFSYFWFMIVETLPTLRSKPTYVSQINILLKIVQLFSSLSIITLACIIVFNFSQNLKWHDHDWWHDIMMIMICWKRIFTNVLTLLHICNYFHTIFFGLHFVVIIFISFIEKSPNIEWDPFILSLSLNFC